MQELQYIHRMFKIMPDIAKKETVDPRDGKKRLNRWAYLKPKMHIKKFIENIAYEERFLVMPGLRGIGKTTILLQLYEELHSFLPHDRILYFSMDTVVKLLNSDLNTIIDTYQKEYLEKYFVETSDKFVLMVDEAHFDPKWAITAKTIKDTTNNVFILVTGSSAISLDVSPDNVRRFAETPIFPPNFLEYSILKSKKLPKVGDVTKQLRSILFDSNTAEDVARLAEDALKNILLPYFADNEHLTDEFNKYLLSEGILYTIGKNNMYDAWRSCYQIVEKTISEDLPTLTKYNSETIRKVPGILTLIAGSGDISINTICSRLQMPKPTVIQIFNDLRSSKLILQILPYGGISPKIRKESHHYFSNSVIHASILDNIGEDPLNYKGQLLETAVVANLDRLCVTTQRVFELGRPSSKNEVDFIFEFSPKSGRKKKVAIEVGYGQKGKDQIKNTFKAHPDLDYGIVVSQNNEIRVDENIVFVPKEIFLCV
jgi:predicted AAA+ superfamily ATPase